MTTNRRLIPTILAFAFIALPVFANHQNDCYPERAPGATLLFPYFEVDLDDPEGLTTLISVQNILETAVFAHAIVWTDAGIPLLDFDLSLDPYSLVSLDLRRILSGELPQTSADGCVVPGLDDDAVAALQAAYTGRPDPQDGLCRAAPREAGANAIGYVTVDVLNECSATIRNPRQEGYFLEGGTGVAGVENALWGEIFLVDAAENFSQGLSAVAMQADQEEYDASANTFYRPIIGQGVDHRRPLGNGFRVRYLQGGAFSSGTEVVIWSADTDEELAPFDCSEPTPAVGTALYRYFARAENGDFVAVDHYASGGTLTQRLSVDGDLLLDGEASFGTLEFQAFWAAGGVIGMPEDNPLQTWVVPILSASGRYSAAVDAVQTGCALP